MNTIYEPRGKAREYSPLALNLYSGCGHKCVYCYVPSVLSVDKHKFNTITIVRKNIITQLRLDAKKFYNTDKQVLMCFTTDPYNPINDELNITREALEILLLNKIPVAILTKGAKRSLKDLDIIKRFGKHIKIGASLTYDNDIDSKRVEAGAGLPQERIDTLKEFHDNGVKTWVSFEPIIMPKQIINLLKQTVDFVDEFQFGKLAEEKRRINWEHYVRLYRNILADAGKEYYIKKTLREATSIKYFKEESSMDYLTLPKFQNEEQIDLLK